jgi:glucose-1-phosphate thymidylyltransferase
MPLLNFFLRELKMQVILFEDHYAKDLKPVTLTRVAFKIMMGGLDLEEAFRRKGIPVSYVVRDYLRPVLALDIESAPIQDTEIMFVNACLAPYLKDMYETLALCEKKERFCAVRGERVLLSYFPKKKVRLEDLNMDNLTDYMLQDNPPKIEEKFYLLTRPYEIIKFNMAIITDNLERLIETFHRYDRDVYVGNNVRLSHWVGIDTSEGPIIIDDNAFVDTFVHLRGPLYIGKNSRINEHSIIKDRCSVGNTVKMGGEIEASIIESFSNKQHHGFLGHAYLGSWINIGAGTCNSDLKNTYGEVKVMHNGAKEKTGMQFLGCIIGDYSKTAINSCIFTGKVIGVSSMVYGYATSNVPSFTNWAKSLGSVTKYNLEAALLTQKRMFARRKIEQKPAHIEMMKEAYRLTEDEHGTYPDKPLDL